MSQTSSNPATLRLPFKEKLAYGMGDLGSNILLDIGTLYLLKFYTDVLGLPELMAVSFSLSPSFYRVYRYGDWDYARLAPQNRPERQIPPVRSVCRISSDAAGDCELCRYTI